MIKPTPDSARVLQFGSIEDESYELQDKDKEFGLRGDPILEFRFGDLSSSNLELHFGDDWGRQRSRSRAISESRSRPVSSIYQDQFPTGIKLVLILASMVLVQFVLMLDLSIIATAIPSITNEFNSLLDVGWYGSSYQLASASLQPMTGKIYSNFKSKWAFFLFFFIFELGSLLCAVAQSSVMLIVARAIAGVGSAGLLTGGLTIVSACLPKQRQPAMLGIMIAIGQLGQASGPLIGGAFTEFVSWRWCFYINLPIGGLIASFLFFVHIPDRVEKPDKAKILSTFASTMDLVGFGLFAPAAVQLLLALQYGGNQYSWNSATVIGLLAGGAGTLALFFYWEHTKGKSAMVPLYLLRQRTVWSSCATMFFNIGVTNIISYYLPIYFQAVEDASPITSGVDLLPNILVQIAFAMVSGLTVQRFGYYWPWVMIGPTASAVAFGLMSTVRPGTASANRIGYQILAGFGMGAGTTMPFVVVQNLVPLAQTPTAMAILLFCQNFGGACFLTFASTVFNQSLPKAIATYAPGANVAEILATGATAFRHVVSSSDLPGVIMAYSVSISYVWYLVCGAAGGALMTGLFMGYRDIRKTGNAPAPAP
ncbi:uncharacterized protein PG986_014170 [Apiospora aurea]|uniref:Major facilitator superfamily (MFS) profile domain-containing protein n=1 Tax=Apiospora aurea TaxID=335848 RepID=A0ABR1PSI5_9PEZI